MPTSGRNPYFRGLCLVLPIATCAFGPATARAGQACPVEVSGDHGGAWERAARSASAKLAAANAAGDCARILVRVEGGRAHVLFSTTDGRTGEREVGRPTELEATVAALATVDPAITAQADAVPPEGPGGAKDSETGGADSPVALRPPERRVVQGGDPERPLEAAERRPSAPVPPSNSSRPIVIFGALAGGRLGTAWHASPAVEGYAAISLDRWDIGVTGRHETGYRSLVDEHAPPSSAFAAGVLVGRRLPLGSNALFLVGGLMQIAVHEEQVRRYAADSAGRFGGYLGLALPRRSPTRFRANLTADASKPTAIEGGPGGTKLSPWWGVALTMGVEVGGP